MYTDSTLQPIADNALYSSKKINYPKNWDKDTIPELFKVTETPRPANTDTEITTGFIIDETHTQIWQIRVKTAGEIQNDKDIFNAKIDAELLAEDLKIIRAITEGDTARIEAHKEAQTTRRAQKRS